MQKVRLMAALAAVVLAGCAGTPAKVSNREQPRADVHCVLMTTEGCKAWQVGPTPMQRGAFNLRHGKPVRATK